MYLTTAAVKYFECVNLLTIPEREADWASEYEYAEEMGFDLIAEKKRELATIRAEVLQVVPARFHMAILDDSLYLPEVDPVLRDDYLYWQAEECKRFEQVLEAAYNNKQATLPFLADKAADVFAESLHDAQVFKMEEHGQDLWVYLNTTGGFTTKAVVILKFIGISHQQGEWYENLYYVYDELEKSDIGIKFKLITEEPKEIVIDCQTIDAAYYYYPKTYHDWDNDVSWSDYAASLNQEAHYFWIDQDGVIALDAVEYLKEVDGEVLLGERVLAETVEEAVQHVFTDAYEDPYAHFSEPIAPEALMDAVLSGDLELRVRSWNTMYAEAEALAPIINEILARLTIEDEDEMMLYVFVRHFYQEGILNVANVEKFRAVIEED